MTVTEKRGLEGRRKMCRKHLVEEEAFYVYLLAYLPVDYHPESTWKGVGHLHVA